MMNQEQKNKIATTIAYMSQYYSKNITKEVISMMVEDLADLDFDKVNAAFSDYRKNPNNSSFPLPAKIRAIINPQMSKESLANEAASRIRDAISRFGWCNPTQAKNHIGELGWLIVERSGGWQYVCENHGLELNQLTFHAQSREIAKGILESKQAGVFNQPVQIGKSETNVLDILPKLKELTSDN